MTTSTVTDATPDLDAEVVIGVRVPRKVREQIRTIAKGNHRTLNGEIRKMIAEHLERELRDEEPAA